MSADPPCHCRSGLKNDDVHISNVLFSRVGGATLEKLLLESRSDHLQVIEAVGALGKTPGYPEYDFAASHVSREGFRWVLVGRI